jgi:hypothetical protein
MTAREFMRECNLFVELGKIKDIDFSDELYYENINDTVNIKGIDFEDNTVTLGTLVEYPCGWTCCGTYYENETYDLDQLASKGYLGDLIDMMENVLKVKTGI